MFELSGNALLRDYRNSARKHRRCNISSQSAPGTFRVRSGRTFAVKLCFSLGFDVFRSGPVADALTIVLPKTNTDVQSEDLLGTCPSDTPRRLGCTCRSLLGLLKDHSEFSSSPGRKRHGWSLVLLCRAPLPGWLCLEARGPHLKLDDVSVFHLMLVKYDKIIPCSLLFIFIRPRYS